jgi:hypothetical protein
MKDIQMLPLVFVNPLHLNIEERPGINGYAGSILDSQGQTVFALSLDGPPILQKSFVINELLQVSQPVQIRDPTITYFA